MNGPAGTPAATLRKVAEGCTRHVRALVETEEEAVDLVVGIWRSAAGQIAHSLRVGKSVSMMPLGVFYVPNRPEKEPALATSEVFIMQYGISVKPGDQASGPGPSLKPAYGEIATALSLPDKSIVPSVLESVARKLGEMCAEQSRVRLDLSPLGELRCEKQRLEFIGSPSTPPKPPQTTEPQKTVRAMLARRRLDQLLPVPEATSEREEALRIQTQALVTPREAQPASLVAIMMEKRGTLEDDAKLTVSAQHYVSPRQHAAIASMKSLHSLSTLSLGSLDSRAMLVGDHIRTAPPQAIQFPTLIDEFSRTLATPYSEELYDGSSSSRIGSYFSPQAAMLTWSAEAKCLLWKVPKAPKRAGQSLELPPDSALEKEFEDQQVLPGSPIDQELRDIGITKRIFLGAMSRYRYYTTDGIKDTIVAPINQTWVQNVGALVDTHAFVEEVGFDRTNEILNKIHEEMLQGYLAASKKAMVDYIFKHAQSRVRAFLQVVPSPLPDWGAVPFVGIEGTYGGPPSEWRPGIENNKEMITEFVQTVCARSTQELLDLWVTAGYDSTLLVDLPAQSSPLIDIQTFAERQRVRREEVEQRFTKDWFDEVAKLVQSSRDEARSLECDEDYEERYLRSVAALLSVQTRSAVSRSVSAFVNFLNRYSNMDMLSPEQVIDLSDMEERQPAFLVIGIDIKENEVRLKDSVDKVVDIVLAIFREFVVCLNKVAVPQTHFSDCPSADKEKMLWGTDLKEQYVEEAEQFVVKVVSANMRNVETCLRIYKRFAFLLTEEKRIQDFVQDSSKTVENYREKWKELTFTEQEMQRALPFEVRMQLASVNCITLNETLRAKALACIDILLSSVVSVNFERNERLSKAFENHVLSLKNTPYSPFELVDLEKKLEQFRTVTQKELVDEFADIRNWQQLVFDCNHLLQSRDFKAIADSASWVHKIDDSMGVRENELRGERDSIETKFKAERHKFEESLQEYINKVNLFKEAGNLRQMDDYLGWILALKDNYERAKFEAKQFRDKEELLGWDASDFDALTIGIEKLEPYDDLWEMVYRFTVDEKKWSRGPLFSLDPEAVDTAVNTMSRRALKLSSLFESMSLPTPASVAKKIKKDLDAFKQNLPLLHALCNPGLRQRHWEEISEIVGFSMERDPAFTLSRILDMEVGKHMDQLQEISDSAAREHGLETTLTSMVEQWEPVVFELKPWKDTGSYIVAGGTVDEMQSLMDDHIIKAQTMKGSPYAKPFMDRILETESWLCNTQELMDIWIKVQGVWLYLEPIFGSEDIVKQMPREAELFRKVDSTWKALMEKAKEEGKALGVSRLDGLLNQLKECHNNLEEVQKGLNDYLETKRLAFPRFFFLSNDNLLEILSETKDPRKVNPHMKKAFEGIQALEFQADNKITALFSSEKEKVPVVTIVDPSTARGNVEQWLVEVEATMLETLHDVVLRSAEDYPLKKFTEWLKMWPGQVVIAVFSLFWTTEVSQGLAAEGSLGVKKYADKLSTMLQDIIELVRNDIPKLVRCTLEALIVIFVHNKDTVLALCRSGIEKGDDFDWLVQMRYYIEENPEKPERQDMFVRITNSFLAYAYEYIGNSSRLVVTPLTDRCYRTCCGALHLLYGAAPEGPAGTGKTETVKDLSKALARFCVVFNCSDELDYMAMAKFFKGLAASGGWACFDEFNRIDAEVLSVIAQQILLIQLAIKERKTIFEFEGTTLPIIWTCNCFITMNPGYAGRAELPDNLKALFRTVAMMVPDYAMIGEIKLYAYGYEDSRSLAQKIVTTYKLCSEQLSSQKHYDYGMRAVFAVLVRAGLLKRQYPDQNESILMLQAINDVNLAKFLDFDVPLYTGITKDLFPGVELPKPDYTLMVDKIKHHLDINYCQAHPYFIEKTIQFYETHLVRHSVMLVGMPFSGKTTALNTLQKALTSLANEGTMHPGNIVHQARLNPKSILARDLYGCFDEVSHEWTDGIVAVLFRNLARNQTPERKWLVFDGPVDAVWIENMNTVMDENKKLCLNSGEIIAMSENMRTIIEPMDVEVASPATISRNGMVFFEPHKMGFNHLIEKTFLGDLPEVMDEAERKEAQAMIDFLVPPLVKYVHDQCKPVSPYQEQNIVQSCLRLLTTHLACGFKHESYQRDTADPKAVFSMIDAYAIFSAIWSFGVICETSSRQHFGQYFKKLITGGIESNKPFKRFQPSFPDRGSIFDHCFDLKQASWITWLDTVQEQIIPNSAQVESITVQTVDNVRYRYILNHCIINKIKLLFCGPTGTGKTAYMQQAIMQLDKESYMQIFIGFSAKTNCAQTQGLVDSKIERRRKGIYGPPFGKQCIVMVDDLNMPNKETYGAQPPIEILRQGIDGTAYPPDGGWYECKDSTHPFKCLVDVLLFGAMGLPGGGRSFITPRILGHFYMVGFPLLDDDNMAQIFSTILDFKFGADSYPSDVAGLSKKIVSATMDIYKAAAQSLLPTPLKVHYTFNLRDFAKVIFGTLLLKKGECDGVNRHVRLWVHEILRVFGDRLIDDTDRKWMLQQLRDCTKKVFQASFDEIMAHLDSNKDGKVDTLKEVRTLFFGDMISAPQIPRRPYDECPDVADLQQVIEKHLVEHNEMSNKPMDLVCFLFMLEHLSRVARVIKSPGGNALLVGVGGSGRQSCTRLACFMADATVFQIEIAKGYDMVAFREDMKKMLSKAGGNAERTVFLFSDSQIKDEGFVEDINNLLNTGEIPNLFPPEEKVAVCELVRNAARDEGKAPDGTPNQLFAFFVDRCRALVAVVVCFSPIGDAWRTRLRQFPSLVNCCTIDWFTAWPADALQAVAKKFLQTIPDLQEDVRVACGDMCQSFHSDSEGLAKRFKDELKRIYYSTPTSFLELIQTFKQLLAEKRSKVSSLKSKYDVGLDKLTNTEQSVESMKEELIALQPQLVEKNKEVGDMMVVVNKESDAAEKVKEVVSADEAVASEAANKANAIKEDCQSDLDEAMPALNEALKALDTLSAKEIAEIKAMKCPPAPVRIVLSAVCVLRQIKPVRVKDPESGKMIDDYWPAATKMIAEMGFLASLQTFDKDSIPADTIKKIATYTVKDDFQPDRVQKVSTAAWGLCMWVRAMETYDRVCKVVVPKKETLKESEAELAKIMEQLTVKRADLKRVQDQLDALNTKLSALRKEQDDLTCEVDLCQKKLERAETLITSLGGEKTRWTQNSIDLDAVYTNLTGDVIVASGLIAYLGAFTPEFREDAVKSWAADSVAKGIPGSEKFSLESCLGEPVKVRGWVIAGLPNDSFSIENGIIVDKARRWPLCIDPQGQANRWIKKMGQPAGLVVGKFTDGDYLKRMEGCIQYGNPFLMENVNEETDPAIEPVLLRQTFKKGSAMMMKIGESIIEYNKDFKFFMTTKLRNPHYLPEVAVKVTLLNFMITQVGLQDQLLNIVVERERLDLAEEKARLVVEGAENAEQLETTENKILDVLSSSKGNILEDEAAVQILSAAKQLSNEIAEKQVVAERTEKQIDEARLQYVPIAFRTAILFFCIADLANIDPMYQYSLTFFINLFKTAINKSEPDSEIPKRVENLNSFFMDMLYNNICRSLFEQHKLLFSFLLTMRLQLTEGVVSMQDYRFLLTGGVSLDDPPTKPAAWIPDRCWSEIFRLGKVRDEYEVIMKSFAKELGAWRHIYDAVDPLSLMQHVDQQPKSLAELDRFPQLLVLRCVRPDRVLPAVLLYVKDGLGEKFVTPPPFNLAGSYSDSSNISPLIFILSPGADPFSALNMFAADKGKEINGISLGQGQGPKAEKMMQEAMQAGGWVLLQNCHLATSWMPKLDKILEGLDPKQVSNDFRLWLTSYPSNKFPVAILQNSVKITNEAPKGLRANLIGSFMMDPVNKDDEFFEKCLAPDSFKRLLFSVCFFHAVIQERRLFGPLGWNIPYEFTQNDLRISVRQLKMFIDENPADVSFKAICYLTGECNYGGRVTDDKDRRLLMTLLADYYNPATLEEGAILCADHPEYAVPTPGSREAMMKAIRRMSLVDPPGVFGFHENANLTREQNETYKTMDNLLLTVGQASGGGGSSAEDTLREVSADILGRMPQPWNLVEVQEAYPTMYNESMNTVLIQELTRFNGLIKVIISSLRDIQKALQGLLLLSAQLELVFTSIFDGKTPSMWLSESYPSLKPLGSYTNDLVERLKFFQKWVDNGIPVLFWISGIFFTQAFTTGATQNFARKYTIPIDTLTFEFQMPRVQEPKHKPENGVYTYGLFLEGCKWDLGRWELNESDPKVLFCDVPMIWILPCKHTEVKSYKCYNCPTYKISSRKGVLSTTGHSTNFIMHIRLPSSIPESHWVKRGVAMLSQLDS